MHGSLAASCSLTNSIRRPCQKQSKLGRRVRHASTIGMAELIGAVLFRIPQIGVAAFLFPIHFVPKGQTREPMGHEFPQGFMCFLAFGHEENGAFSFGINPINQMPKLRKLFLEALVFLQAIGGENLGGDGFGLVHGVFLQPHLVGR